MIKVYDAANGADAHLILDLLTQAGLQARVDGEYLQGGIGELQAFGMVRVMVTENDYQQARQLIKQWQEKDV